MHLQIGDTIASLRRARNITQEQLATAVGVSAPAVSKWETGQSYPDITLLAPLARYFDITVDALLAYEPVLTEEALDALAESVNDVFAQEGFDAGLACMEKLMREYPSDATLRLTMASLLTQDAVFITDPSQKERLSQAMEAWLQFAVEHAQGEQLLAAKQLLAYEYIKQRRLDEAEAIFDSFPENQFNPRQMMPTLRMLQERYDEAIRLSQQNLFFAINDAIGALTSLTGLAVRQENAEAAARYANAGDSLLRLFEIDNALCTTVAQNQMNAAHAAKNTQALLHAAEAFAKGVIDMRAGSDSPYLDHLFRDGPTSLFAAHDKALLNMVVKDFEANPAFDMLRDDPAFAALLDQLRRAASA